MKIENLACGDSRLAKNCRRTAAMWASLFGLTIVAACGGTDGETHAGIEPDTTAASSTDTAAKDPSTEGSGKTLGVSKSPIGFAAGVTGGAGGKTVRVSTADDLIKALCGSNDGSTCTDDEARVIEIDGIIDMTDHEGSGTASGCEGGQICSPASGFKTEITLGFTPSEVQNNCRGKTVNTYTYKKAATKGIRIGSNKTLVGIGANASIKGKGLYIDNDENIIVRNISITDLNEGMVWGGDAVKIPNAKRVWLDHNYIARAGRQLISTGTGDGKGVVDDVTISNNEFDGRTTWSTSCDGTHYWTMLMHSNGKVTMSGNYLHHFGGRGPRIASHGEGALVHIVNNYFADSSGHAIDYDGNSRVLVEGNHFSKVPAPVATDPGGSGQLFGFYKQSEATKSVCKAALGRQCNPNVASPRPTDGKMVQDSSVLSALKSVSSRVVKPYSTADVPDTVKANAGTGKI